MLSFWEQFALMQASAALNVLLVRYGAKFLRPEELAAASLLIAAIADLPERIHAGGVGNTGGLKAPDPQMFIR